VGRRVVGAPGTAHALLARRGESVADFEFRHGTMDDVFLALTGHGPETATGGTHAGEGAA